VAFAIGGLQGDLLEKACTAKGGLAMQRTETPPID